MSEFEKNFYKLLFEQHILREQEELVKEIEELSKKKRVILKIKVGNKN